MVSAVVLAGSKQKINRALLEINNRWLVEYVVNALKESSKVSEITVVGPKKDLELRLRDYRIVDSVRGFVQNALNGYKESSKKGRYTFFIHSDIPAIKPESIDYIIENCKGDYDFFMPFASHEVLRPFEESEFFRDLKNFRYLKLVDGWFRTSNCAIVDCEKVIENVNFLKDVEDGYNIRKVYMWSSLLRLGLKMGLGSLYKYRVKKDLTFKDIKEVLLKKTGLRFEFPVIPYPENSIDVDDIEIDYPAMYLYLVSMNK